MFEMSIFYTRLKSFSPLWRSPRKVGTEWTFGWREVTEALLASTELRVCPGLFKISLPKADSSLPSVRTDAVIEQPSPLSIIGGNFTFINHFEATPHWASRWVPAPKPTCPKSPHLRTTTPRKSYQTWHCTSSSDQKSISRSVSALKCGFLAWEGRWPAKALPAAAQHHSSGMSKPFCIGRAAGLGGCTSSTQGIKRVNRRRLWRMVIHPCTSLKWNICSGPDA